MPPLFTVIVPTYNRAALLRLALKSLAAQTFKDYEAFIIDDGSTDGTRGMLERFSGMPGWNFIYLEKNGGQARARNSALRLARGAYVTFLDSDDVWLPERLQVFADLIGCRPEAGFLFSNGYIMREDRISSLFFDKNRPIPEGRLAPYMAVSDLWLPYVTTNVVCRTDAALKAGGFREDLPTLEDTDMYTRILAEYEVAHTAETLSIYRIHSAGGAPASVTLDWDRGIKYFLLLLDGLRPPAQAQRLLKAHVLGRQAEIFLKNGMTSQARALLRRHCEKNVRYFLLYTLSFTPKAVIRLAKAVYGLTRDLKARNALSGNYRTAQQWFDALKSD